MRRKMTAMMLSVKSQADEGQWEPNGTEELPTPYAGETESPEVREAGSPCHELHMNTAHSRQTEQWETQYYNETHQV